MQRYIALALCAGVLGSVSVKADPMPLNSRYYSPAQPVISSSTYSSAQPVAAMTEPAPVRYASATPNLGGGLLEALFGGPRDFGAPRDQYGRAPGYPYGPDAAPPAYQSTYGSAPAEIAEPAKPDVDPRFKRQIVDYSGPEAPGTVVINTRERLLYLVQNNGTALRYGIGVGRPGFAWAGVKHVSAKREWPDWRPPSDMLKRRPDLPRYMPGGPDNPLGARAMYLGSSLYRIHGSNEPWTIGQAVSSGCIRMRNEDVVDLYNRVKVGTKVIVI